MGTKEQKILEASGLEYVSEFKYLECVLDESSKDGAECSRRVARGRRVAGTIRFLVNVRDMQLESSRILHETLLVPVLMYGSKTMLWKEKDRSRIRAVQMNNLRSLLGIRRVDTAPNAWMRELCGVTKWVDDRIDEGVPRSFGHIERMENNRIA